MTLFSLFLDFCENRMTRRRVLILRPSMLLSPVARSRFETRRNPRRCRLATPHQALGLTVRIHKQALTHAHVTKTFVGREVGERENVD